MRASHTARSRPARAQTRRTRSRKRATPAPRRAATRASNGALEIPVRACSTRPRGRVEGQLRVRNASPKADAHGSLSAFYQGGQLSGVLKGNVHKPSGKPSANVAARLLERVRLHQRQARGRIVERLGDRRQRRLPWQQAEQAVTTAMLSEERWLPPAEIQRRSISSARARPPPAPNEQLQKSGDAR
jgi:hypothetical protein